MLLCGIQVWDCLMSFWTSFSYIFITMVRQPSCHSQRLRSDYSEVLPRVGTSNPVGITASLQRRYHWHIRPTLASMPRRSWRWGASDQCITHPRVFWKRAQLDLFSDPGCENKCMCFIHILRLIRPGHLWRRWLVLLKNNNFNLLYLNDMMHDSCFLQD